MPYFTKDGSIPKPQTDGTNGWVLVPDPPTEIPEGKELVWLNWEWVVRDPKPTDNPGFQWNWNHSEMAWVESPYGEVVVSEEVVIESPSAMPIDLASAMPV